MEASSDVLIEKMRSVITDERGAYRIVDLRPGTYSLQFSLPGFAPLKREIELQSNFVATVNAELQVGAVAGEVTVTAESPVVDVQTNSSSAFA